MLLLYTGHDFISTIRILSKEIGWYGKFIGEVKRLR